MRFHMYAKTDDVEELFYDSESGIVENAIAQPNLKLEVSKAGTLEFTILPTHPMYNSFQKMKTYIRVMQDDYEIFRGRVLSIEDTTYLERNIQCEGDLAYLIDSFQPPQQKNGKNTTTTTTKSNADARAQYGNHVQAKSSTIEQLNLGDSENVSEQLAAQFRSYINQHNSQMEPEKQFTVGSVTITDIGKVSFSSTSYRDTKAAIDSDLLNPYGGYLRTRHNDNGPTYIDWLNSPDPISQQPITLGVNMIDLTQKREGDEFFTVLVPIGENGLTISSVNGGNMGIEDSDYVEQYGRIYKVESFNGIKDANELKKLGLAYIDANLKKSDKLTLTVKAIDMNLLDGSIESIHVGSEVTVISEPHGISYSLACISIEYDIQNPENNSYEIGDPSETISQKTRSELLLAKASADNASGKAGRANSAAGSLKDTVNRHAENIMDHADTLYKLEADLVQVHAKCIEITASEKVTVTTDQLDVNANGDINVKSNGSINMAASALLNFNDTLYLGNAMQGYDFYSIGAAWMQELTIGGHLYVASVEDENGAGWSTQVLSGFLNMNSASFTYTGGSMDQTLEDAVKSFGQASVDSTGEVSIPYYTFYSESTKAGDITFNIAGMAYYQSHIGIYLLALNGPISQPYQEGENKGTLTADRYYQVVATPNDGQAVKFFFKTPSSGSSSAVFERVTSVPSGVVVNQLRSGDLYHFKYTRNGTTVESRYYAVP